MAVEDDFMRSLEAVASVALTKNGEGREYRSCRDASWKAYSNLYYGMALSTYLDEEISAHWISTLFGDGHQLDYMIIVLEEYLKSALSLRDRHRRALEPVSAKLSRGLKSLPDELIGLIFEFIVPPRGGTREAFRLSHVSRRFRNIAITTPELWSTLYSEARPEQTELQISRCGPTTYLHLVFSVSNDGYAPKDVFAFINSCLPMATRWASLSVASELDHGGVDDLMNEISEHRELTLPKLHTFEALQHRDDLLAGQVPWTDFKFIPTWTTPSLRVVRCDGYIPLSSPSYASLQTFVTSLSLADVEYPDQINGLVEFLGATRTLKNLDLNIRSLTSIMQPLELNHYSCPSITSFQMQILSLKVPEASELLRPLMLALEMPNVISVSVTAEVRYEDIVDLNDEIDHLTNVLLTSIPDLYTSRKLSTLNFELKHTKHPDGNVWPSRSIYSKGMVVPHFMMPQVTEMTVTSFSKIRLEWVKGPACSLRKLGLHANRGLERLGDIADKECNMREIVQSLKDGRIWDDLERVEVDISLGNCVEEEVWDGKVVAKVWDQRGTTDTFS